MMRREFVPVFAEFFKKFDITVNNPVFTDNVENVTLLNHIKYEDDPYNLKVIFQIYRPAFGEIMAFKINYDKVNNSFYEYEEIDNDVYEKYIGQTF